MVVTRAVSSSTCPSNDRSNGNSSIEISGTDGIPGCGNTDGVAVSDGEGLTVGPEDWEGGMMTRASKEPSM